MRTFYEEWNTVFEADAGQLSVEDNLADASAKLEADREIDIWQTYLLWSQKGKFFRKMQPIIKKSSPKVRKEP